MASAAVVLAVGASPMGQASRSTPTSMTTSLFSAMGESSPPVKEMMRTSMPLEDGKERIDLGGMAAVGNGHHDVIHGDHAQVAVNGLSGVEKEGRGARAVERGRDLPGHEPGFSHARQNDPALGFQNESDRVLELGPDPVHQVQYGLGLDFQDFLDLFQDHGGSTRGSSLV